MGLTERIAHRLFVSPALKHAPVFGNAIIGADNKTRLNLLKNPKSLLRLRRAKSRA